jgi:cephalosporin hydroxylase
MTPDELSAEVAEALSRNEYSSDPVCQGVVRAFNQIYYGKHGASQPWSVNHWRGATVLKCPEDLFIYQELLFRIRPNLIVETGVAYGGSTLFLADMCELLGHGSVLACDVTLGDVHPSVLEHSRVRLIEASSTSPEASCRILEWAARVDRVMVILDSDHSKAHVAEELRLYSPIVTPRSYLIVEDTNINGNPVGERGRPGPGEAVTEFLAEHPEFERDAACERLLVTFNPGGYLRRK